MWLGICDYMSEHKSHDMLRVIVQPLGVVILYIGQGD
jgi:hypothetical protein